MENFKPNLAGTPAQITDVPMPCYASPKIDGIRAMCMDRVKSRSMKDIPNDYIQAVLKHPFLSDMDGELVVGSPTDPNCMQNTTSGVMAKSKTPEFTYLVFDIIDKPDMPFSARLALLTHRVEQVQADWARRATEIRLDGLPLITCPVVMVPQKLIHTYDELAEFEAECLAAGYEGAMVRGVDSLYKQGRSTVREGGLLKIKRFVDGEFLIVGFEEQMKNNNVATTNELGRTKRSTHAAGKTGKGTLGAFKARHILGPAVGGGFEVGAHFSIGSGMDDKFRDWAWANQDMLIDQVGSYKSFPVGVKDAPRHPVFKALREKWDMS